MRYQSNTGRLTQSAWKIQLIKNWFEQNEITNATMEEARSVVGRWGLSLQTKRIARNKSRSRYRTEVLDPKGAVLLTYEFDESDR